MVSGPEKKTVKNHWWSLLAQQIQATVKLHLKKNSSTKKEKKGHYVLALKLFQTGFIPRLNTKEKKLVTKQVMVTMEDAVNCLVTLWFYFPSFLFNRMNSYRLGTIWGWVNDRIHFLMKYPFNTATSHNIHTQMQIITPSTDTMQPS